MLRDGDGIVFRRLGPDEGSVLTSAIVAAYGSTYDVRWVYDADEVRARLADGRYVSVVAETAAGELLCHMGMSRLRRATRSGTRARRSRWPRRVGSTCSPGPS